MTCSSCRRRPADAAPHLAAPPRAVAPPSATPSRPLQRGMSARAAAAGGPRRSRCRSGRGKLEMGEGHAFAWPRRAGAGRAARAARASRSAPTPPPGGGFHRRRAGARRCQRSGRARSAPRRGERPRAERRRRRRIYRPRDDVKTRGARGRRAEGEARGRAPSCCSRATSTSRRACCGTPLRERRPRRRADRSTGGRRPTCGGSTWSKGTARCVLDHSDARQDGADRRRACSRSTRSTWRTARWSRSRRALAESGGRGEAARRVLAGTGAEAKVCDDARPDVAAQARQAEVRAPVLGPSAGDTACRERLISHTLTAGAHCGGSSALARSAREGDCSRRARGAHPPAGIATCRRRDDGISLR